jgi:hypothetical protein
LSQVTVTIIRGGDSLVLTSGSYGLANWDGWGLPPVDYITTRGPMQHGATTEDYRLRQRAITLMINIDANNAEDMYDRQAELLEFFKPGDSAISLRAEYPSGRTRQIDCRVDQGLTFPSDWQAWFATVPLRLLCDDPTWYDPAGEAATFALGAGGSGGAVPYTVPYYVGASIINMASAIDYDGSWWTYPIIRITGPIRDCKITNASTDEVLSFSGTTIGAGEYYEIDLRYGYKTVEDSSGANKIALLSTDSDIASFHLAADPEVADGINSISVAGYDASEATKVELRWYERYIGV